MGNGINVNDNKGQVNIANENATINIIKPKEFNPRKKIMYPNLGMLSPTFIGRDKYVKEIDSLLDKKDVVVLSANGGIGKTQVVLKYIKNFKDNYEHIAFVNASTSASILQDYAELLEVENDENLLKRMKQWSNSNKKWLFVYDNFDNEGLKQEFFFKYVVEGNGKIIITSRLSNWKEKSICIEKFNDNESIKLLEQITELNDGNGAKKLSKILDNYPLALDQAGSYIRENNSTYEKYIELFENKEYKLDILSENAPDIYHNPIAKTWKVSFDNIKNAASKELLNIISFLDGNNIPQEIFEVSIENLSENLKADFSHEIKKNKVFNELKKYSLIKIIDEKIYIHSLVQDVVRYSLTKNEQIQWFDIIEDLLVANFNYDYHKQETWDWTMNLLIHVLNFVKLSNEYSIENENIACLLNQIAVLYYYQGKYEEAEDYYKNSLSIRERIFGTFHPYTAKVYGNLGTLYEYKGLYNDAEFYFKKALAIFESEFGTFHPETARVYGNLGNLYHATKMYDKAEFYLKKDLTIKESYSSPNDSSIALVCMNLGVFYKNQSKYNEAEFYYMKSLTIYEKVLNLAHPAFAQIYGNLGVLYMNQNKYDEAEFYYKKALVISEKILTSKHPETAMIYGNLGLLYYIQKKYTEAEIFFMKDLIILEKIFGPEHPDTIKVYSNLSNLYYMNGNYKKTSYYSKKMLIVYEKVFGTNHPNTKMVQKNLEILEQQMKYSI